jgi:hypothetical protein
VPGTSVFPNPLKIIVLNATAARAGGFFCACGRAAPTIIGRRRPFAGDDSRNYGRDCRNGYRFAKSEGKPNAANQPKPRETSIPAISRLSRPKGVYAGFIAILKLPFKFDRS